jgi:putative ABC transport system permease protein
MGEQQDVALTVPWLNLTVIFTVVYLASLASTLLPAIRASRVYPAEALRYE